MQGYYRNPTATQAIYHNGWWDSGDYAYQADGEFYITGRKKDLIIKAGRNIYPEAIEEIVGQIEGIRKGCVIAFGVSDEVSGTEKLIVVAETRANQIIERVQLMSDITDKIMVGIGVPVDTIILAAPGTIPKTSSGKLQRSACKYAYMRSKLAHRRFPAWLQISKLFLHSTANKIWAVIRNMGHIIYGVYIGLVMTLLLPILLLGAIVLSQRKLVKLCHAFARSLFFLAGCRITISGKENLNKFDPMIIVSNHTSYVDVILLIAILPSNIIFIGKKEMLKTPIIRTFFKKMGDIAVDRLDFTQSLEDTEKIKSALQQKQSLIIFPEGTFTYATGLRPFKYGAFKVAMETRSPICPIALKGTRHILRDGTKIPRRGNIKVTICEPLLPKDQGWHEIVRLSADARLEIAKYCGEQAIDLVMAGVEIKK
jgi:1-acyl-sn-glycerol-3-phosphate acyltransferase